MATFKICIYKHQERSDGKFPVWIRVCWKRKYGYIKTNLYVSGKQIRILDKNYSVKDPHVIAECNSRIAGYEDLKATKIRNNINLYTARELAEYFVKESASGTDPSIDFVEFAQLHCKRLIARGRGSTAKPMESGINALVDFCNGRRKILITEITARFLEDFESFLGRERILKRKNQFGKAVVTKHKGLSRIGIFNYMVVIRTIFNAAMREYNDEDRGELRIRHYPFRKYKLPEIQEPEKRVLTIDQVRSIIKLKDEDLKYPRAILGRDVFLLSFCLAGMNTADLYDARIDAYTAGRLSYCRQKTRDRRRDRAFISINVEPEALPYFKKYRDKAGERVFCFHQMYSDHNIFCSNVNEGLKYVAALCGLNKLTTYYARFSFASIARNNCGVSKDDINLALDHVDASLKMADAYIEKDWSLIDRALRKVLDILKL